MRSSSPSTFVTAIIPWYRSVKRPLPWRIDRNPYRIWISEVMLQQTTVTAVIPYYEKFLKRFPNLKTLASANESDILEMWAGLGYYSRARALFRSAKLLQALERFPETHSELLALPGFGPYTARAVSSLAFGEPVGVVDGNVIRILTRVFDLNIEWWKSRSKIQIQDLADQLVQANEANGPVDPSELNQALMELGATICTPKSPSCMICPWNHLCLARTRNSISNRPSPKPRKKMEIWAWFPEIHQRRDKKILLVKNDYAPFLKSHMMYPGRALQLKKRPNDFDYKGAVTHFEIFVNVVRKHRQPPRPNAKDSIWISSDEINSKIPSTLIRKALDAKTKD